MANESTTLGTANLWGVPVTVRMEDIIPVSTRTQTPPIPVTVGRMLSDRVQQNRAAQAATVGLENSTPHCAARHLGLWMIEPPWFRSAVDSVKAGTYRVAHGEGSDREPARSSRVGRIAVIPIQGPIMKGRSKFGGTSSVDVRVALRKAVEDDTADAILFVGDSPGGSVAGIFESAKDIAQANKKKPVYGHAEDLCASGCYLLLSQCRRITADATTWVGSIGVVTELVDTSGKLEKEGIKVHVVSTGGMKGAGMDGKVTEELKEEVQEKVNRIGEMFISAVAGGRASLTETQVRQLADGRTHIAEDAKRLGLIDAVASLDDAIAMIFDDLDKLDQEKQRMNAESFQKFAMENPEAQEVKDLVAKGHKQGYATAMQEAKDSLRAIAETCPGRPQLVIDAFLAGQDAEQAKLTVSALERELSASAEAEVKAKAEIEAKQKRIEALEEQLKERNPIGAPANTQEKAEKGTPDAKAQFDAKVKALTDGGMDLTKAVAKVVKAEPDLVAQMRESANAAK